MKIKINELKTIQDVIKYLKDYRMSSDVEKCVSVLMKYADQQKPVLSGLPSDKEIDKYMLDHKAEHESPVSLMIDVGFKAGSQWVRDTYQPKQSKVSDEDRKDVRTLYNYLEDINAIMWESFMIKDRQFTREDGLKIMQVLDKWADKF